MKLRHLGTSGLQVSQLGLGTMTWGRDVSLATARELLTEYVHAGGNLLDTAAAYGQGRSEQMIGQLINSSGGAIRRDDLVIATKAGFSVRNGRRHVDTSRTAMLRDLDESLKRLGTDWIDLWQVHSFGEAPIEETLAAMDHAISSGKVRYLGVSNFVGWQTAQAATWQRAFPMRTPLTSNQTEYSLLARRAEVEIVPAVQAFGMGFIAWSPMGRGVLTGKYRDSIPRDSRGASDHFRWFVDPYLIPRYRGIVEATVRAGDGMDLEPGQVALLWTRDAPGVSSALLGSRTTAQLRASLATEALTLPAEIIAALDDISGGPAHGRVTSGPTTA